jgi:hypothetical protein
VTYLNVGEGHVLGIKLRSIAESYSLTQSVSRRLPLGQGFAPETVFTGYGGRWTSGGGFCFSFSNTI